MIEYNKIKEILNRHHWNIKSDLLRKISEIDFKVPYRFSTLSQKEVKLYNKNQILQHLLQSHEIRFGDAMEELITEIIEDLGYRNLPKNIRNSEGETLSIDQYFTNENTYYFIEQKVRDDHDSTKKRGQINNFEKKLEVLNNSHGGNLIGIMYFIDPDLRKNQNFYVEKLREFSDFYGVELHLFYGRELFEYFDSPQVWDDLIQWLKRWKDELPELPEINFDENPEESFEEIKELEIRYWRKILQNEKLWDGNIMEILFKEGTTLTLMLDYFRQKEDKPHVNLARLLEDKLKEYY